MQTALNRAKLPFGARKAHPMRLDTYEFKMDKKDYNVYWDVRKGLIPIVGGARETGDTCWIHRPLEHISTGAAQIHAALNSIRMYAQGSPLLAVPLPMPVDDILT